MTVSLATDTTLSKFVSFCLLTFINPTPENALLLWKVSRGMGLETVSMLTDNTTILVAYSTFFVEKVRELLVTEETK